MSPDVFALVLLAAIGHAGWNFAARWVSGNFPVFWLSTWAGAAALTPFVIAIGLRTESWPAVTPVGIACVIGTGLVHALYFILLARAYSRGEISVVYPIARGSGIGITALLAWQVLSEEISFAGLAGIGLVFAGILVMGIPAYRRKSTGIGLALSVGLTIPAYSIIDKIGVSLVHPTVYVWLMYLQSGLFLWPFVRRWHGGEVLRAGRRYWPYVLIIGVGASMTYMAILFAFQLGRVSYIVALREVAVVIGAILGILVLKERLDLWKAIAIGAITAGIVCIKAG